MCDDSYKSSLSTSGERAEVRALERPPGQLGRGREHAYLPGGEPIEDGARPESGALFYAAACQHHRLLADGAEVAHQRSGLDYRPPADAAAVDHCARSD